MASERTASLSLVAAVLLCSLVLSSAQTAPKFNVTKILDTFPEFSEFNRLLSSSGVAEEINSRSSVTVLALSNGVISSFLASNPNVDSIKIADLLRYHVLLQFLSMDELKALDTANYTSVTTLLQTTGRANENDGFLNIYNLASGILIGPTVPDSTSNVTVVKNITNVAFDISIIQIDQVLLPVNFNTVTGDLIEVLESFKEYTLFVSFLKSTGVDAIFAGRKTGGGITVFAPKDSAFNELASGSIQDLSVTNQKLLMQYHALTSYQSLDILENMVDSPVQTIASTVATGYLLSVTAAGKKVTLLTGVNDASITETLYNARPVTMFGIDAVLLPSELFGADALVPSPAEAPVPDTPIAPVPESNTVDDLSPPGSGALVATSSVALSVLAVIASSVVAAL